MLVLEKDIGKKICRDKLEPIIKVVESNTILNDVLT